MGMALEDLVQVVRAGIPEPDSLASGAGCRPNSFIELVNMKFDCVYSLHALASF